MSNDWDGRFIRPFPIATRAKLQAQRAVGRLDHAIWMTGHRVPTIWSKVVDYYGSLSGFERFNTEELPPGLYNLNMINERKEAVSALMWMLGLTAPLEGPASEIHHHEVPEDVLDFWRDICRGTHCNHVLYGLMPGSYSDCL